MDLIHIGETVEVDAPNFGGIWRGEVMDFVPAAHNGAPLAKVRCIEPPANAGHDLTLRVGVYAHLSFRYLTRVGDPEGMRADGDDTDVTDRCRPYHRHAVTGEAHAHPGGWIAHTHQIGPHAAGMVRQEYVQQEPPPNRPMPDPVEVLARHFTWTGNLGANERSIHAALTELVAGPWHLVTLADNSMTGRVHEISDVHGIDQEWRP